MEIQTIITTILVTLQAIGLCNWANRISNLEDNLWIEPLGILFICLLEYLIWK